YLVTGRPGGVLPHLVKRMPREIDIAGRIKKLVSEREHHAQEVARIDQVLGEIKAIIPGRGNGTIIQAPASLRRRGRRGRGGYAVTANDLVVGFVKEHKNPTSREIAQHWRSQGRAVGLHNTLSQLVKAKKLKRTKLEKGRGSHYSLP